MVLCGDLNIDINKKNVYNTKLSNILSKYNITHHITTPTRLSSCIDHFISNITTAVGAVHNLCISDHTAQTLDKFKN